LHGWLILAGFVAIAAVWLSYVYSQASDADADGQILALVVFGIPAAAALAGWAVGTIVGRIVKAAATEASPAFALTPP
jgi:NADH:ubiquinone oxidoreductase subunit K